MDKKKEDKKKENEVLTPPISWNLQKSKENKNKSNLKGYNKIFNKN